MGVFLVQAGRIAGVLVDRVGIDGPMVKIVDVLKILGISQGQIYYMTELIPDTANRKAIHPIGVVAYDSRTYITKQPAPCTVTTDSGR